MTGKHRFTTALKAPTDRSRLSRTLSVLLLSLIGLTPTTQASEQTCKSTDEIASHIKPYETNYAATFRGVTIDNRRVLTVEPDKTYRVSGEMSILFVGIREYSRFRIKDAQSIEPFEYLYERDGLSDSKDFHIAFDWKAMQAKSLYKGDDWTQTLEPGSQDMLSQQMQFRLDLLCNPTLKTTYEYPITKKKSEKRYRYAPEGEEVLDTPLGKLNTIKFRKLEDKPGRETTVWLAKDWDYLIAKLVYREKDGATQSVAIKEGTLNGTVITGLNNPVQP